MKEISDMINTRDRKQLVSLVKASCQTRLKMWTADYDECVSHSAYLRGIQFSLYQIPEGRRIESDAWQLCMPIQGDAGEFVVGELAPIREPDSVHALAFVEECVLNAIHVYEARQEAYGSASC